MTHSGRQPVLWPGSRKSITFSRQLTIDLRTGCECCDEHAHQWPVFYKSVLESEEFIMPEYALVELNKYSQLITDKTRLNLDEHTRFAYVIFSKITILPYVTPVPITPRWGLKKRDLPDFLHRLRPSRAYRIGHYSPGRA